MGCWRWKAGGVGTSRSPLAVPGPGGGDAGAGRSQTARRHGGSCYLPPADNEPGTDTRCLFANWHREVIEERGREEREKITVVISAVVSGVGDGDCRRGGRSGETKLLGDDIWPPTGDAWIGLVLTGVQVGGLEGTAERAGLRYLDRYQRWVGGDGLGCGW